ncbi:rhodanese-related sulfurtransferase [Gillisia mitskevichiae]|uniref:Rhodanese-related sulfurtransferase n=1 Tax=Gillisia mitskevichiae TaxID=270921 RepID=A0A495PX84_9FLAO|nr:rhodanese-like domain-containing protein [Gillisia mitskevichiae]RKS53379.1 rhodanese-related sulfurtransferase [Gillisia mitskevichiae]
MSKLKLVIIMGLFASIFGLKAQSIKEITVLDATEFKEEISEGKVALVDVRTENEYNAGNIKNSVNIDFFDPQFITCFTEYDKEQPIYVYCQSGNRSGKASKKLAALGFTKIYDLKGGYAGWKNSSK